MGRRLRPLTAADLDGLPEACASCAFWESGLTDLATFSEQRDRAQVKRAWAEAVTARWGYCGVMAVSEGRTIGYLTMAPAMYVPRLSAFATTPVSQDAAVLIAARVLDDFQGKGIGRQLVQAAAGMAARRDLRALEAVGTYREGPSCMLPAGWLESVGFAVVREHPVTPRLRLDLQSTVRWRADLSVVWSRLTGLVAQPAPPEPAAFTSVTAIPFGTADLRGATQRPV
jgi:GNAT superfamily N-acetyltransferase